MAQETRARIAGTGSFTPTNRMTNADFEKMVDTSDDWIVTRTGIKERRIADDHTHSSDMALAACKQALDMANCPPEEVDMLILGTVTPDYRLPSTACVVQEKMSLPNAVAYDIVSACCGFINGLSIGSAFIKSGQAKKALVVGVERLSSITNYDDRTTCVLFGDGAGAALLEATDNGRGVASSFLRSDGRMRELLWIPTGGTKTPITSEFGYDGSDKIRMNGSDVYKVAVREMVNACKHVLADAEVESKDVSLVIPHQANIRIIDGIAKRLHVPDERIYRNIEFYGNTSAASVPIALDEANRAGRIKEGDYVLMVAFGGGLIWGSTLIKW